MKAIKHFLALHHRAIGNLANYLGVGSAIAALAGWVSHSPPWLFPAVSAVALVALALAALRIAQLNQRVTENGKQFDDLMRVATGLLRDGLRDKLAKMEQVGIIPITEMAAFFQTLRHVRQECGADTDALREIDQALAQLAEYERRVTGR